MNVLLLVMDNHNDNYCIAGYFRMVEIFVVFVVSVERL